jgi:hypothetical protein
MNTLSFAGVAAQSAWLEIVLCFTALTIASAYPDRRCFSHRRAVAAWLSIVALPILAAGSGVVAMMYPETLAAAFSQI